MKNSHGNESFHGCFKVQRVQRVQRIQWVQSVQKVQGEGCRGFGPKVLKFDGPSGRRLWYRPAGDEYKVSVTGFSFGLPVLTDGERLPSSSGRSLFCIPTLGFIRKICMTVNQPLRWISLWCLAAPPSPRWAGGQQPEDYHFPHKQHYAQRRWNLSLREKGGAEGTKGGVFPSGKARL